MLTSINRDRNREDCRTRVGLLSRLVRQDLDLMSSTNVSTQALTASIDELVGQIEEARAKFNQLETGNQSCSDDAGAGKEARLQHLERDLQLLKKKVSKLKSMFPFCVIKKPTNPSDSHINWRDRFVPHSVAAPDKLIQNLTSNFNSTPSFEELKASVRLLKNRSRICLICFLVFPENAIIKRSLLDCWATANDIGFLNEPVGDLIGNGFIQPVYKDSLNLGGYWMQPSVRSTLTNQNWLQASGFTQWMYVADSTSEDDIIYEDPAQFAAAKELRVLHMGNWQRSSVRHIEVEGSDTFFKDMAQLSKLRYFSLRGVSLVTELPKFITKLDNLEILDLKACHNLEVFPSNIDNLWWTLTHLDMSECYFLDHMPMAFSKLRNLRVLKGFVVGEGKKDSCTLGDLLNLMDLRKLNIYSSLKSFPEEYELSILKKFRFLQTLTISWGGCSTETVIGNCEETNVGNRQQGKEETQSGKISGRGQKSSFPSTDSAITNTEMSFNLEKLDLQCFPNTVMPDWLKPINFNQIKKLYVGVDNYLIWGNQRERTPPETSGM